MTASQTILTREEEGRENGNPTDLILRKNHVNLGDYLSGTIFCL